MPTSKIREYSLELYEKYELYEKLHATNIEIDFEVWQSGSSGKSSCLARN
jgi:hypothetical protein